ncbi:hypothetical protein [Chryseobacterium endophyticum]|uniref:Exosortase F system-associated protein n=1 Tax=Chryseobacterium endophyticum TaxID=1854762 RepID=A0AAU6WK81_9FLAO|nr:hypothetical protein [uncultured Chryseobacterium sp.]
MKKLIISNFIFLLLLNLLLAVKEYLFMIYNVNSGFDDLTYFHRDAEGSFGFGVFRVSFWWIIYFLLFSLIGASIFNYLKNRLKRSMLLILLVTLQILLSYSVNRLILMNVFGFFKIENILFSVLCVFIFWYLVIYKGKAFVVKK